MNDSERRAYSRGYAAGRAKKRSVQKAGRAHAQRQAFLDRCFIAALPACIESPTWRVGERNMTSLEDKVTLARLFAFECLRQRPLA